MLPGTDNSSEHPALRRLNRQEGGPRQPGIPTRLQKMEGTSKREGFVRTLARCEVDLHGAIHCPLN